MLRLRIETLSRSQQSRCGLSEGTDSHGHPNILFSDFFSYETEVRENPALLGETSLTVRGEYDTITWGREQVREMLPYLQRFAQTGYLLPQSKKRRKE